MKQIPVKTSISRINNNSGDDYVELSLYDGVNGNCLAEVQLSLENYALLITGISHIDGDGKLYLHDNIGVEKYVNTVRVVIDKDAWSYDRTKNQAIIDEITSVITDKYNFSFRPNDLYNHHFTNYDYHNKLVIVTITVTSYGDRDTDFDQLNRVLSNKIFGVNAE